MIDYEYEVTDFEKNPILRELTKNHVLHNYEENADTSDYSLWQEYCYLKNEGMLHVLFESEKRTFLEKKMELEALSQSPTPFLFFL